MRYGDYDNVTKDAKVLHEIFNRQGSNLLIDVIAEQCGKSANKFDMSEGGRNTLLENMVKELKEAILERI